MLVALSGRHVGTFAWDLDSKEIPWKDVTADDVRRRIRPCPPPEVTIPSSPFCLKTKRGPYVSIKGFPNAAGGLPALVHYLSLGNKPVDFVLGGSGLHFLAFQQGTYELKMANGVRILDKSKSYTQDFGSRGFQFEKALTGPINEFEQIESMQVVEIGSWRVLLSGECDGSFRGQRVEMKTGCKLDTNKLVLQMVSSGSSLLIQPEAGPGNVIKVVKRTPLEKIKHEVDMKCYDRICTSLNQLAGALDENGSIEVKFLIGTLRTAPVELRLPSDPVLDELIPREHRKK